MDGVDLGVGWQNNVASVGGPRGELAPLSCHTHNMKGSPLNVMEVAGTSRNQYEWKVDSNKIGSCAMFFLSFAIFGHASEDGFWQVFDLSICRLF